jgi:predicted enzyme related to lactoylglutathione lyase
VLVSAARLIEVELFVNDLERSVALYRDVIGLPLEGHAHAEGDPIHHHAAWGDWEAGPGGGFLLFSIYSAGAGEATRSSFGFTVPDLDAVHRQVEASGAKVVQAPQTRPWGRSATYQDADGNTFSLTQA